MKGSGEVGGALRRIVSVVAAVAAMLALGAGAVFAQAGTTGEDGVSVIRANNQVVQCVGIPCRASGSDDLVHERVGNRLGDDIRLSGGDDQVRADTYGNDRDTVRGGSGYDLIYADDGDTKDLIYGGKGNDKCYVDARSEAVRGCSAVIVR